MNLIESVDRIQKTTSLVGEDLVTLTAHHGIDALPTVALAEELLKLHDTVNLLGTLPP